MKLVICAGPPTCGKTTVLRQVTKRLLAKQLKVSFLKIDVQYADEDEIFQKEFSIPTRKVYSGELCPDHCTVMVLGDALQWAERSGADLLMVETAGLCLRCSPYVEGLLGIVVLEATSGMNLPRKIGPMLSLADVAVVT
jgi:Ni2+-binding GTPase involved in maturation of urease and hydrogenase